MDNTPSQTSVFTRDLHPEPSVAFNNDFYEHR